LTPILADEDVDGRAVKIARDQFGIDIIRAIDVGLMSVDDPIVCNFAQDRGYVLITGNFQDYPGVIIDWAGGIREHNGVIIINKKHRNNFVLIARKLVEYAFLNLRNRVEWI